MDKTEPKEEVSYKYRHLSLRNQHNQHILRYRSKFNQLFTIMTLNDISWIGIKNLLQIRHGLWCSASNKVPKNLVRRVTDAEWSYFQPGMFFLLSLY